MAALTVSQNNGWVIAAGGASTTINPSATTRGFVVQNRSPYELRVALDGPNATRNHGIRLPKGEFLDSESVTGARGATDSFQNRVSIFNTGEGGAVVYMTWIHT